jgi:hypothetical protein
MAAFSEPETQNVRDLMLSPANKITHFLDCHSYGSFVSYPWSLETNTTDPADHANTFENVGPRDGVRRVFDTWSEYIDKSDEDEMRKVASAMSKAIALATGARYQVCEGARMGVAISGCAIDYAYSRHLLSTPGPKIWPYTIECGSEREGGFSPTKEQFAKIERDVHAAILALLRYVATGALE